MGAARCELREVEGGWQVFFISDHGQIRAKNRAPTREAGEALLLRFNRILERMQPATDPEPCSGRAVLHEGPLAGTVIPVPLVRWAVTVEQKGAGVHGEYSHSAYFRSGPQSDVSQFGVFRWFEAPPGSQDLR
jgi:hypothetical protein